MIPEKPEALLWMDVETTGLDANMFEYEDA